MKPRKIPYENQEEIYEKFIEFIDPFFREYGEITESYLWGSLAAKTFGLYEEEYEGQIGSDVDLVIFINSNSRIPKDWELLHDHSWMGAYKHPKFRDFKYKGNIHKVDLLVAHPGEPVEKLERANKKLKKTYFKIYPK